MSTYDAGDVHRRPATAGEPGDTGEASLGELFSSLTSDLSQLVRSEMELARVEIREEAGKAGKAAGMLGGAAVAALVALILLSSAAAWGLAELVDAGWAFLIVGAVIGAVAAVVGRNGRNKLAEVRPVPDQTVDTLKEDARWARAQVK